MTDGDIPVHFHPKHADDIQLMEETTDLQVAVSVQQYCSHHLATKEKPNEPEQDWQGALRMRSVGLTREPSRPTATVS